MSCLYILRICWSTYFRYQKIIREIIGNCHKTHTICWSKFGVCWYMKWICLGICSICGVFVQSVGYLINMWRICSICGSFVQYVTKFNENIYFIKKLGCMTFIIIPVISIILSNLSSFGKAGSYLREWLPFWIKTLRYTVRPGETYLFKTHEKLSCKEKV